MFHTPAVHNESRNLLTTPAADFTVDYMENTFPMPSSQGFANDVATRTEVLQVFGRRLLERTRRDSVFDRET